MPSIEYMRETAAQIAHEANRGYCQALGDMSQEAWEYAPDWQRESAIKGVQHIMDNPSSGPGASHRSWLKEKAETGWKYGPVKDPEKKEHPCFVPFEELPVDQQAKDFIFLAVVRGVLTALGA